MRTVRRHLQALARLALLAMVSLSLLPTLAHAFAQASGGQAMTEVCTPQGMKLVVLADEAPASPADTAQKSLGHLDHCPYCCPGLQGLAPPPQSVLLPPPSAARLAPALFLKAPHTLFVWRTSQPRGPPLQS